MEATVLQIQAHRLFLALQPKQQLVGDRYFRSGRSTEAVNAATHILLAAHYMPQSDEDGIGPHACELHWMSQTLVERLDGSKVVEASIVLAAEIERWWDWLAENESVEEGADPVRDEIHSLLNAIQVTSAKCVWPNVKVLTSS